MRLAQLFLLTCLPAVAAGFRAAAVKVGRLHNAGSFVRQL